MKNRKGPAQSGHNAKPFDWHAWNDEQKNKRREYLERERLRSQMTLPLKVPSRKICPDCGCRRGVKCQTCKNTGFVDPPKQEVPPKPFRATVECRRCWGVGQVAGKEYIVKQCPECEGSGRVEASGD